MYKLTYLYNSSSETEIYDDEFPELYNLISGKLSISANSAGNLDLEITYNSPCYDILRRMRGLIKAKKNNNLIWEGRISSEDIDFYKNKILYCEGILACLNDTRQPQKVYTDMPVRSFLESVISIHNQKVDESKQFRIGIVTVNNNDIISGRKTNFESTWDVIKDLVSDYGGYLYVRYDRNNRYIDYIKECLNTSSQKIEFGENLLDFSTSYDLSSLCTVLLPLGEVKSSSGSNSVGEKVDANITGGYYLDENFEIQYDSSIDPAYSGSSSYFEVDAGKTYYISCRNHSGRAMWALRDSSFNLIDYSSASTGEGMTDLIESRIEIPPSDVGNRYLLAIAGFGQDIIPRVNKSAKTDENFDQYVTVESVNDGSLYVKNSEAITTYGWIENQLTWENISDPSELKSTAEKYLRDGQFDEMTLTVSAIDLNVMNVDIQSFNLLEDVLVISPPHGLYRTFPITELEIDFVDKTANKLRLGKKQTNTLTGVVSSANDSIYSKIKAMPSKSEILLSALENATMVINNTVTGIFTLEKDQNGINTGFRLSNVADYSSEDAKGWRFTMGGLGYFGNGFSQPVTIALTGPDGGLVANCVTTGTMYADRIHGGTLTLGGYNNDNGIINVRDANGNSICILDNNGADITGKLYNRNARTGYWARLDDSALFGGYTNNGQEVETTRLSMTARHVADREYIGLRIDSDTTVIYTDVFGIADRDGEYFWYGRTDDISCAINMETNESPETFAVVESFDSATGILRLTSNTEPVISEIVYDDETLSFQKGILVL